MKFKLKYLGIGLFLAGLILTVNEQFNLPFLEKNSLERTENKAHKNEIDSLNATIAELESEVESLSKQLAQYEASDNEKPVSNESNTNNSENNNSDTDNTEVETVHTGTIYIYEAISLYDIGRQAEDLKIVANGRELELYLAKPEFARSIQKGIFELNSSMTLEEMAKTLTGKK